MLPSWCNQTVTIMKPGIKDVRGSEVFDWENPSSVIEVEGCSVQPSTSTLSFDGRVLGVSEGLTVYAPEGTLASAGDHIIVDGETYVTEEPKKWQGVYRTSHIQLTLRRWQG